jgi:hypothetical protein
MQHIILFENFGSSPKEIAQEIIGKMEGDGDFRGYKLSLDSTDPGVVFIIWENPQDDEQWGGVRDTQRDMKREMINPWRS